MTQSTEALAAPAPLPKPRRAPGLWGAWATFAWTAGGLVVFALSQIAVVLLFFATGAVPRTGFTLEGAIADAPLIAAVEAVSALVTVGYFVFAAHRSGLGVADYLALKVPRLRHVVGGILLIVAVEAAFAAIAGYLDTDTAASPMSALGSAADPLSVALTVIAVLVLAPVQEEITFRGFALPGLARSWGTSVALLITAAVFASLHLSEYDAFGIGDVFALGLALGWLRLWSGSTLLTIGLHLMVNSVALVPALLLAH